MSEIKIWSQVRTDLIADASLPRLSKKSGCACGVCFKWWSKATTRREAQRAVCGCGMGSIDRARALYPHQQCIPNLPHYKFWESLLSRQFRSVTCRIEVESFVDCKAIFNRSVASFVIKSLLFRKHSLLRCLLICFYENQFSVIKVLC